MWGGLTLLVLLLFVLSLVIVPIAVIWSLNTLFALGIVISLKTWLATLVLAAVVYGGTKS